MAFIDIHIFCLSFILGFLLLWEPYLRLLPVKFVAAKFSYLTAIFPFPHLPLYPLIIIISLASLYSSVVFHLSFVIGFLLLWEPYLRLPPVNFVAAKFSNLTAIFPFPRLPLHFLSIIIFLLSLNLVLHPNYHFGFLCLFLSDMKMMASLVINSIRSAINSLEKSIHIENNNYIIMKYKLKHLETLVLCARKLGNDAPVIFHDGRPSTLGSCLRGFHYAILRFPRQIQADCYNSDFFSRFPQQIQPDCYHSNFFLDIERNIDDFVEAYCNTLSDSLPQPTFDEVTVIIDSVLGNLRDFVRYYSYLFINEKIETIEAMVEKITFFRNFIRFVTLSSVVEPPQLENLLVHIQAVIVTAASISYLIFFRRSDVSPLQKVKIIDPGVYEAYTQALISSKLSTQMHSPTAVADDDALVTMKDFIDSLLSKLWERVQLDTRVVISTTSQLQLLYEGLRFLKSMLKEQPNKFDEKIRELTRVVICDAGVIIFSLYRKDVEALVSIPDMLQRINRIREEVEGKDISYSDLLQRFNHTREEGEGNNLPRTNELGFIKFLLENLVEMTSSKACHDFQSQFQMIHDELSTLRCSLGEIEEVHNEQKGLEALWNAGVMVAYRVEFLIDQLVLGDFEGSCSASFDSTVEDILKEIKSINSEIHHASDIKVKKVSMTSNLVPSRSSFPLADEIVGLDNDAPPIIDRLTRGSEHLKIVAIVGMPGIGKTTLATKVYNDPRVTFHFHKCAWCRVSQLFNGKKVILELLNHIVGPNEKFEMDEHDLADKLRRSLKGERYLIFLDDVWDIEVWNCLQDSFPDDSCGSRIILTSRYRDVALLDEGPHFVRQLTEDESWELLKKKLFPRNDCNLELYELGKQIAANCKGLPLTVVVVAGLLANTEAEGWKTVLENMSSISENDHCMKILELSYKHLPDHLKPCFLYFGLFPEDEEVSVEGLIWLWIAEGFVRKTESKSLEDVARDYMMDLVGKSLVIVSQKRSRGGVKACRIHDLLHYFCRIKAKEENFFHLLKGYDEILSFEEPGYMRRLCVRSERKHFKNLRLFCPCVHSLLFFAVDGEYWREHDISFIIPRYSRLRVLDIRPLSLGAGIPGEIKLFLQLKYLSVRVLICDIPSSIGSLVNLETLIVESTAVVSLTETSWNLQKLRHLDIQNRFRLPIKNLEDLPDLCELQSCSCATIGAGDSIERIIRKFPNIRQLRCALDGEACDEILIPDSLSRLESLHLVLLGCHGLDFEESEQQQQQWVVPNVYEQNWFQNQPKFGRYEFDFPRNLRKLTLEGFSLRDSDTSRIGKLPNLEVLKLHEVNFHEQVWDMEEGEFPKLIFLELARSNIVRWTASDDQFPCLQKLILKFCEDLEEIPSCFENIDTLEMVEVSFCSYFVKRFFKRIQDEQEELGNSVLKIHFYPHRH